MARITSSLDIQLSLARPVEDLAEVISAVVLSFPPEKRKKILEELDIEVGNALAAVSKEEEDRKSSESKEDEIN